MGSFLLGLCIVFFFFSAYQQSQKIKPSDESKTIRCPPHVWKYGSDDHLVCETCHHKPGYEGRS